MKFDIWHRVSFEKYLGEFEADSIGEADTIGWKEVPLTRDDYSETDELIVKKIKK